MCAAGEDIQFGGLLRNQFADRFIEFWFAYGVCEYDAYELGNAGKQEVRFCRAHGVRFTGGTTERILEEIDRTLNQDAVLVEVVPMLGAARDSRI